MNEIRRKVVLFDWDGVIAKRQNFKPIWDCLQEKYGIDQEKTKSAFKKVDLKYVEGKISNEIFWETICSDLRIECDKNYLNEVFFGSKSINNYLLCAIKSMREKAYVGIVSNNFDLVRDKVLGDYNHQFDAFFFSCDTGYTKPSIKPFELVSKKFNVEFEDMIFVDDDVKNLDVLKNIGIKTIHFKWDIPDTTHNLVEKINGLIK